MARLHVHIAGDKGVGFLVLFVEEAQAVVAGLDAPGNAAVVVRGKKQDAYASGRACSNAGALRSRAVTPRRRSVGAPAARSASERARTSRTRFLVRKRPRFVEESTETVFLSKPKWSV